MPANRRGATTFLAPATRGLYSLQQLSAWPGAPKVRRCHLIRRRDGRWRQPGGSGAQGGADRQTRRGQRFMPNGHGFPFRRWFELDQADANIGCSGGIIRCARPCGLSDRGTVEQVRSWRVGPGRGPVAPDPGDLSPSGALGRRLGGQSDEENRTRPCCPGARPRACCTRPACCCRSFDG